MYSVARRYMIVLILNTTILAPNAHTHKLLRKADKACHEHALYLCTLTD
jgi:hypothetical protein